VAGAVEDLAVADEIVDAAGAVDGLVVAGVIADAAGRAGDDTRSFFTDSQKGCDKQTIERPRQESWPFCVVEVISRGLLSTWSASRRIEHAQVQDEK
jgi:hypothetical protein